MDFFVTFSHLHIKVNLYVCIVLCSCSPSLLPSIPLPPLADLFLLPKEHPTCPLVVCILFLSFVLFKLV